LSGWGDRAASGLDASGGGALRQAHAQPWPASPLHDQAQIRQPRRRVLITGIIITQK